MKILHVSPFFSCGFSFSLFSLFCSRGILLFFHFSFFIFRLHFVAFFKKSAIQDGFISFNYATSPLPKNEWDEFQIHKRALGIIGIVDCQNTANLTQVSLEFRQLVSKFPGVLCTRCFAFEPTDNHADNEPGIVMIPNQGREQLMFYLSTMIEDLAVNFLKTLSPLVRYLLLRKLS